MLTIIGIMPAAFSLNPEVPAASLPAIVAAADQAVPLIQLLIGTAGFSGLPVSTTHIISSGVAGTMAGSGAGVQKRVVWQIVIAWVATLPATNVFSGALFWVFSGG